MNRITLLGIGILIIALIPGCHATTVAYDRITFTDTPAVVEIEPGSEAAFDVTLRNAGSQYADVDINTRSIPDGISIVENGRAKLVDIGKVCNLPDHDPCKRGHHTGYTPVRDRG